MERNITFNIEMLNEIWARLCEHKIILETYHLTTISLHRHHIVDEYLDKFNKRKDKFMEVAQGYLNARINSVDINLTVNTIRKTEDFDRFIENSRALFIDIAKNIKYDPLLNIIHDISADFDRFIYLSSFK